MLLVRIGERIELAPGIGHLEQQHHVGIAHQPAARLVVAERMGHREVHAPAQVHDRGLQRLGELDEKLHAVLVARAAVGDDHRALRGHEPLGRLGERRAIALRRPGARELRDFQALLVDRLFLQVDVAVDEHRLHRRRRRDLVGAHRRLGEVLQRHRIVVPLHEIAHQQRGILHRVVPLGAGAALHRVQPVAREDHHRRAVDPGVVDRHRRVLHADAAVDERPHGLARGLRIAVRHGDRGLLVHAGEQLRLGVAAIVHQRLVQAAEARARVDADIFDSEPP